MKRILTVTLVLLIAVAISGCSSKRDADGSWSEDDFSFYDENNKEKTYPTVDDYWIFLSHEDGLQTKRGIETGDKASSILEHYNLTDFEWSICDFSYINPSTDKSEAIEERYRSEGKTTADIMDMLDEISANGLDVYIYCDIYKQNGRLCTLSELDLSQKDSDPNYTCYTEPMRTERFISQHLKYTISFDIDGISISDVEIKSNYHNCLRGAYNVKGEFMDMYAWLKELE